MKTKTKIKKIVAGILGFALIAFILYFANGLIGNPISKLLARQSVSKYLTKEYPHMELVIDKITYDFKFSCYNAIIKSPKSIDTVFSVETNGIGKVINDNYESQINNHFSTWLRLTKELDEKASSILRGKFDYDFDYTSIRFIEYEKYAVIQSGNIAKYSSYDELMEKAFKPDMKLDIKNPPMPLETEIVIFTNDMSWNKIAEITLKLDDFFENEGIPIEFYSVRIIPKSDKKENGEAVSWINSMNISYFPKSLLLATDASYSTNNNVSREKLNVENLANVMEKYQTDYENRINNEGKK